jgi:hypothetical protein
MHDRLDDVAKRFADDANFRRHLHAIGFEPGNGEVHRKIKMEIQPAPPRYIGRCIVIKQSGTSLGWYALGSEKGPAMERMLYPVVLTKAFFHGAQAFGTATIAICKDKYQQSQQPQKPSRGSLDGAPSLKPAHEQAVARTLPPSQLPEKPVVKIYPFLRGDSDEGSMREALHQLQSIAPQKALDRAVQSFKTTLLTSILDERIKHTPGLIDIYAEYDFVGKDARAFAVTIVAPYSVKDNRFVGGVRIDNYKFVTLPAQLPALQHMRSTTPEEQKYLDQKSLENSSEVMKLAQAKTRSFLERYKENRELSRVVEHTKDDINVLREIADELEEMSQRHERLEEKVRQQELKESSQAGNKSSQDKDENEKDKAESSSSRR